MNTNEQSETTFIRTVPKRKRFLFCSFVFVLTLLLFEGLDGFDGAGDCFNTVSLVFSGRDICLLIQI